MEGYLYKWTNMISGWKPRYIIIKHGRLEISNSKEDENKKIYNLTQISLVNQKKLEFILDDKVNKIQIFLKAISEVEKASWIFSIKDEQSRVKCEIMESNQKNTKSFRQKIQVDPFLCLKTSLNNIQENIFEMNLALSSLHEHLQSITDRNHPLYKSYEQFVKIKQKLRDNIDETLVSYVEINQNKFKINENTTFYDVEEHLFTEQQEPIHKESVNTNNFDIKSEDSFEDCQDLANLQINFDNTSLKRLETNISNKKDNIVSIIEKDYSYDIRTALPSKITSSTSMISDMVKAAMKEKASLPITYNEPLSMLQRCVEPFQFFNLLDKAYKANNLEDKFAFIIGFIVSQFSLNINRLLKPFNPLLGETYEYIDKINNFSAFSEQVSHHPPISAFLIENPYITVYGDTKGKHKFLLMKGALEMTFNTNTNILFHSSKKTELNNLTNTATHHFIFGKPTFYMKGIIYGTPHYDYSGNVELIDLKNPEIKAVIEFIEEGKKGYKPGSIEGKILKNNECVFLIKGNWSESVSLYSIDGSKLQDLWVISDDNYITNKDTINNYLLSQYAYDLNNITDSLKGNIPISDSRLRPDQRLLESGCLEEAEELKKKLEEEQRKRGKVFEKEKKIYKPMYFESVTDSTNSFYVPSRNYWDDRINKRFDHIVDIFEI